MIIRFQCWSSWRVKPRASLWSVSVWQTHRRSHSWWGCKHNRKQRRGNGLYVFMWSRLTSPSLSLSFPQPSGILPCPPSLIVSAVLSLLRTCSGVSSSSSSSAGCSEVRRNVIGSGKVQKCALEALTALSSSPGETVCVGWSKCSLSFL